MTYNGAKSVVGVSIQNVWTEDALFNEFLAEQFGKYAYSQTIQFCYECWIDSMMDKE
ncbi:MAG: hypothetical protein WC055_00665 [Melioribacteraceae bacterium]